MKNFFGFLVLIFFYYYVCADIKIKILRDTSYYNFTEFPIYWNLPNGTCRNLKEKFDALIQDCNITTNPNLDFRGPKISLLYDPGQFPHVKHHKNGSTEDINGVIPQNGSIDVHLEAFRKDVKKFVQPEEFTGLAVIDFEHWRPILRQNWNNQTLYKNLSIKYESEKLHKNATEKEAKSDFEEKAKEFMEKTLQEAKKIRKNAKWGYYGFPYCYNAYNIKEHSNANCTSITYTENDQIDWLFKESKAFYPSVYLNIELDSDQRAVQLVGKMNEAWRMVQKVSTKGLTSGNITPVYPYLWFLYLDDKTYMNETDTEMSLKVIAAYRMGGAVIWGKSDNLNSEEKCNKVYDYMFKVFCPALKNVRKNITSESDSFFDYMYKETFTAKNYTKKNSTKETSPKKKKIYLRKN